MSTETESPALPERLETPANAGFGLPDKPGAHDVDKLTDAIAQLETTLLTERDAWREKEFLYIAVIALLSSVVFFKFLENNAVALILISLFEAIILFGLAKRLGVDWAERAYGWLVHIIGKRLGGSDDTSE